MTILGINNGFSTLVQNNVCIRKHYALRPPRDVSFCGSFVGTPAFGYSNTLRISMIAAILLPSCLPGSYYLHPIIIFLCLSYARLGVDELVNVADAVVLTPSSSGMGRAYFFVLCKQATCNRKQRAENPSISTLH